jgi:hypothetical protein
MASLALGLASGEAKEYSIKNSSNSQSYLCLKVLYHIYK